MPRLLTTMFLMLMAAPGSAQEVRYITDTLSVPLRSGQGTEYRILHRGLPSSTRLLVDEVNEETGYSHVTTPNGTEGWILSRYLMSEIPTAVKLEEVTAQNRSLLGDEDSLRSRLVELQSSYTSLSTQLETSRTQLETTAGELAELQRVSGNALSLDTSNRRLTQEAEVLKTRMEVLEADNLRLQDSNENEAFLNGALAVLIGVMITLLVPRMWPKRRPSSSWA